MALDDQQKGFYDTRRQFQGRDDPDTPAAPDPAVARSGIPRGQLVAGLIMLALLALGFFTLALPGKSEGEAAAPAPGQAQPAPAAAPAGH